MEKVTRAQALYQQQQRLSTIIDQRSALIQKIGTGKVEVGSSWEATLRVGRVRRDVGFSIAKKQVVLQELSNQIGGYERAQGYQEEILLRQQQLGKIAELHAQGYLSKEILSQYQTEYEKLLAEPTTNVYLRRGLELLHEETTSTVTPTENDQATNSEQGKEEGKPPEFELPNGVVVTGKEAQVLILLDRATSDNVALRDELIGILMPNFLPEVARRKFSSHMGVIRKLIESSSGKSWQIIGKGLTADEFGYYIQKNEENT